MSMSVVQSNAARAEASPPQRGGEAQLWVEGLEKSLVHRANSGDNVAMETILDRYRGFVRLKASAYFIAGGESEDLIQEGMVGLYKAVRDYRPDREASFRSFAELCVTRQIITAIKTAARNKHTPLNSYVSFSQQRAGASGDQEMSLAEILPSDPVVDPVNRVISSEGVTSMLACLEDSLSSLESDVLVMYLEDRSYEEIAERLDCTPKTVDNALQRVKRKVMSHLRAREVQD